LFDPVHLFAPKHLFKLTQFKRMQFKLMQTKCKRNRE